MHFIYVRAKRIIKSVHDKMRHKCVSVIVCVREGARGQQHR